MSMLIEDGTKCKLNDAGHRSGQNGSTDQSYKKIIDDESALRNL